MWLHVEKSSSRRARLYEDVRYELRQLQRLAADARTHTDVSEPERSRWEASAAAKYVSDVCAGLENLCKRRNAFLNIATPAGPDSHIRILEDFLATPDLGGRLAPELGLRLKRYLRFRHRFIHGYAFEISWEMVSEPLSQLPETVEKLAEVWTAWLARLTEEI